MGRGTRDSVPGLAFGYPNPRPAPKAPEAGAAFTRDHRAVPEAPHGGRSLRRPELACEQEQHNAP